MQDEIGFSFFGNHWMRDPDNRNIWICDDDSYRWKAVVDDFGNLVPITNLINMRGY